MADAPAAPSYRQAVAFYLRDDVSTVLWELANRRPLRFHYHSDLDFRPHGVKAKQAAFHCLASPDDFRRRIVDLTARFTTCGHPFFPFWNMHHAVNAPGRPDVPIGWDMRFEMDFDLSASFEAILPVLAVLEHFGIPALAKYSGHRSLHLTIPAEAFPPPMRRNPDHREWTRAFETLGHFLCRIAPALGRTGAGHQAKDLVLTAPYSFHRYHGRIGLPLDLAQAMQFDPDAARLDRFEGVAWRPSLLDDADDHMTPLLELAARSEQQPDLALRLAERVFRGPHWDRFARGVPSDPIRAALLAGPPTINHPALRQLPEQTRDRLHRAMLRMDDPDAKTWKMLCIAGGRGFNVRQDDWLRFRMAMAEPLAIWVREGLPAALAHLRRLASTDDAHASVLLAVRLASMLPEPPAQLFAALADAWREVPRAPEPESLFVALAMAEPAAVRRHALDLLDPQPTPESMPLRTYLASAPDWRTEQRPDLAAALLCLLFGRHAVRRWLAADRTPQAAGAIAAIFGRFREDGEPWEAKPLHKLRFALSKLDELPVPPAV